MPEPTETDLAERVRNLVGWARAEIRACRFVERRSHRTAIPRVQAVAEVNTLQAVLFLLGEKEE